MISENKPSKDCEYEIVEAYSGNSINGVSAEVDFDSKVLKINNFKKGLDYSLRILGVEIARIWNPENCKLNEFNISYPARSTYPRSFEFRITGKNIV